MTKTKISNYTKHIASNWLVVVGLTAAGLAAGYGYNNYVQEPLYKSSATLLLVNKADESISASSLVNNYSELFRSRSVLEAATNKLGYEVPYETLLDNTTSSVPESTEVIKVGLATDSPETSQSLMTAAIDSFYEQMATIYGINNLEIVDQASFPTAPINVDTNRQLAVAGLTGLVLSLLLLAITYSGNSTTANTTVRVEASNEPKRRDRKTRKSDNEIILGDDDDLYDSFLFDESILEDLVESENKPEPKPIKKPGSKLRSANKKQ